MLVICNDSNFILWTEKNSLLSKKEVLTSIWILEMLLSKLNLTFSFTFFAHQLVSTFSIHYKNCIVHSNIKHLIIRTIIFIMSSSMCVLSWFPVLPTVLNIFFACMPKEETELCWNCYNVHSHVHYFDPEDFVKLLLTRRNPATTTTPMWSIKWKERK